MGLVVLSRGKSLGQSMRTLGAYPSFLKEPVRVYMFGERHGGREMVKRENEYEGKRGRGDIYAWSSMSAIIRRSWYK